MAELLTEPLRARHADLRRRLERLAEVARLLPELEPDERQVAIEKILEFLGGELWLHAEAEERWLYPEIALQLRHPLATRGMAFDNELLREQIETLTATDIHDTPALQAVLYGLYALLDAHFRKEEEIYLPLLEYEHEASTVAAIEAAMGRYERGEPEPAPPPRIDLDQRAFPAHGLPIEKLTYLLRYAAQAPSSHNSQPWLFRATRDAVELLADRARALPVADPEDRELLISCGAALFNLRLAIRHHGFEGEISMLPDEADPDLLARIRLGEPRRSTREEDLLFWAIASRHTNRNAFEAREVPEALLEDLERAASSEGAQLRVLKSDDQRHELAGLVAESDRRQFADAGFRRELASWIHSSLTSAQDGMPASALDIPALLSPLAPLVVRTFDVGKGAATHDRKIADGSPVLAVLGTADEGPHAWLAAGQALARVLLRAAQDEVSASFLNQPIEVDELRAEISRLAGMAAPQVVLRLGYGPKVKPTLRRALSEIVLLEDLEEA